MPTDDIAHQRIIDVYLSCGHVTGFRCKPQVGDYLLCVRCDSPVRVISDPTKMPKEVA